MALSLNYQALLGLTYADINQTMTTLRIIAVVFPFSNPAHSIVLSA